MPGTSWAVAPTVRPLVPSTEVVVRTTTGLEEITVRQLERDGRAVVDVSKRQVVIVSDESILTSPPASADDLFVVAASCPDPGRARTSLARAVAELDLANVPRYSDPSSEFAITASFVGRRNYTRFDIEDVLGDRLQRAGVGRYVSRRDGASPGGGTRQWRSTLDGTALRIGPRTFTAPLHRRPWRSRTVLGSVHPPVAAAMIELAHLHEGLNVLDPCCGAGTLLLEGHARTPGARFWGMDLDRNALMIARLNAVGTPIQWVRGDAARVGLARASVDRIVCNPPWGRRRKALSLRTLLDGWSRIVRPTGLMVLLVNQDQEGDILGHAGWRTTAVHKLSVAGQHPRIIVARPEPEGIGHGGRW